MIKLDSNGLLASGDSELNMIYNQGINIYPNPVGDVIYFQNNTDFPSETIIISDILGREMERLNAANSNKGAIEVRLLNSGIYFLNFYSEESLLIRSVKFIKY